MPDDPLAWETLEQSIAYRCPGFDIVSEQVRLPNETETDFDYLKEPPSVAILPFTADNEIVIIEEWRQAVKRISTGLPVGTRDPDDETLVQSATRELAEETGYEAGSLEHLITVEPANGIASVELHVYVARDCQASGTQDLDHDESIRVRTTTPADLFQSVADGEIRDGRTVMAVSYYRMMHCEK
ncbi:MAG: NUDIX hydrolase [Natrialbaceae archaeon]|nr:NUDIX hydrolase [Natrialbaceae archaeon]